MSRQAISLASKRIRSSNESMSIMATTINELIDAQNCLQKENEDLQESRTIIPPEILRELEETKNELKEAQEEPALSDFKHLEMKWKQKFESQKKKR
jgi:rRNA-processing protein FCF1